MFFPLISFAKIGVGVGTGKIEVDEKLNPGSLQSLPSINVINTGDEAGDYEVGVEFHENIEELRPEEDWFVFNPQSFYLEPDESKLVEISLNLPVKVKPGKYFAYIEGRPIKKSQNQKGASIGVAAAAKLYFEIKPANFISGVYYRLISLWNNYAPWTYIIALILLILIIIKILSKFISFNVGIKSKKSKNSKEMSEDFYLKILASISTEIDKYISRLPEDKFENIFEEAKKNKRFISKFLKKNNIKMSKKLSPELKKVLILLKKGLDENKHLDNKIQKEIKKRLISGILQ
jgi:hypothetical protein